MKTLSRSPANLDPMARRRVVLPYGYFNLYCLFTLGESPWTMSTVGSFFAEGSGGEPFEGSVQVPRGEYVPLPVATYIWAFFDPCDEIRCPKKIINDNAIKNIRNVFVSIDGKPVRDLASHPVKVDRSNPQVFFADAGPKDADDYGGNLRALQGGYWLMLEPLPPGPHYIVSGAIVPDIDPSTGEPTGGTVELYTRLTLRSIAPQHHLHHK